MHTWHRRQFLPSLQPRGLEAYLQGSEHIDQRWPIDPTDGGSPSIPAPMPSMTGGCTQQDEHRNAAGDVMASKDDSKAAVLKMVGGVGCFNSTSSNPGGRECIPAMSDSRGLSAPELVLAKLVLPRPSGVPSSRRSSKRSTGVDDGEGECPKDPLVDGLVSTKASKDNVYRMLSTVSMDKDLNIVGGHRSSFVPLMKPNPCSNGDTNNNCPASHAWTWASAMGGEANDLLTTAQGPDGLS